MNLPDLNRPSAHAGSRPVILGGSNPIATYLIRRLDAEGRGGFVVARRPLDVPPSCEAVPFEALDQCRWLVPPDRTVISVLPLAVLVRALPHLEGAGAIVAISSTSLFSKARSPDPHDRAIAAGLAAAEAALTAWCGARCVPWTILRPTLVYDGIGDRNVARMARMIRRYGIVPIGPPARGRRQPIHADDIAKALMACLDNPAVANRAFNIAGGEVLTYRAMAERVFASQGRRPRFLSLPVGWLERGFRLAAACGLLRPDGVGASTFRRMNEDLIFDVSDGLRAMDYGPRRFELPGPYW